MLHMKLILAKDTVCKRSRRTLRLSGFKSYFAFERPNTEISAQRHSILTEPLMAYLNVSTQILRQVLKNTWQLQFTSFLPHLRSLSLDTIKPMQTKNKKWHLYKLTKHSQ